MANQVHELETAILKRAQRLANEYRQRAEHSRDNILRDAHKRLHLREEREVLVAKAKAERVYRRKVQANELNFHKEMDHLRWSLVQGVKEQLGERMLQLAEHPEEYRQVFINWLTEAAAQLRTSELVAEVNAKDLQQFADQWEAMARQAAPDKTIHLHPTPIETLGGVLLRSEDNRIRIVNTFEGREERFERQLHQTIIEQLLPNSMPYDNLTGVL